MAPEAGGHEGTKTLLKLAIFVFIFVVAFSSRLFAVIRFESIIHEFDPWFASHLADIGLEIWHFDFELLLNDKPPSLRLALQVQLPRHEALCGLRRLRLLELV